MKPIYKIGDKVLFNIYHKKNKYEGDNNSYIVTDYCETKCGVITAVMILETTIKTTIEYEISFPKPKLIRECDILTTI
jgi:hypothetical protein